MKKVTAVLLGAGARGTIYARYALEKPEEFEIVAVAEPDAERRRAFARTFGVPEEKQFGDCMELLAQGTLADAALICTMDQMHTAPALKALELGYGKGRHLSFIRCAHSLTVSPLTTPLP